MTLKELATVDNPISQYLATILIIYLQGAAWRIYDHKGLTISQELRRWTRLLLFTAVSLPLISVSSAKGITTSVQDDKIQGVAMYTVFMLCGAIAAHIAMESNTSITNTITLVLIFFPALVAYRYSCGWAELKHLWNAVPSTPMGAVRELQLLVVRYVIHAIFYAYKAADWVYYRDSCQVFEKRMSGGVDAATAVLQEWFAEFDIGRYWMAVDGLCRYRYFVSRKTGEGIAGLFA